MLTRTIVIAALVVSSFVAVPAQARVDVSVDLNFGPPPARVVVVPPSRHDSVWSPGYWGWDGRHYVWIEGRWVQTREGYRWIPERWEERDHHRYHFEPGRWERTRDQYRHEQHQQHDRHGPEHRDNY